MNLTNQEKDRRNIFKYLTAEERQAVTIIIYMGSWTGKFGSGVLKVVVREFNRTGQMAG